MDLQDCVLKSLQLKKEEQEPKPVCCWLSLALLKMKDLHQMPEVQNLSDAL